MNTESHSKLRSALQKLVLLTASLIVTAFLMEGLVLLIVGEQPKVPRHVVGGAFGLRINDPNVTYRHKTPDVTVFFHINGQGMRADEDYTHEKPPGTLRIVSLGDSFTMGHEVQFEEAFSRILERTLRAAGYNVQVLNTGVSGYGTAEECLYLERELFKYAPDVILVSFFGNDLVDNVRSNLFTLKDGELIQSAQSYVPMGRVADFLNRNTVLNFLSERSNAFAFFKERITEVLKWSVVHQNLVNLGSDGEGRTSNDEASYQRRLAAAIFERIYLDARRAGVPLIVQSIPFHSKDPEDLIEAFPIESFNFRRDGLYFVSGKDLLEPFLTSNQLYYEKSDGHWTPFSHRQSGEALAKLIQREHLLENRRTTSR